MSRAGVEIVRITVGRGWVLGSLTLAWGAPRAAMLVLPPFFHEWQRSYRLFALLADALAQRGVTTLRFDYRGCGDSSGDDAEFLPSRALEDADSALALLRARCAAPTVLLGIRAGALLAEPLAERHTLPWWSWQAVEDGAAHLASLRQRDAQEINNRSRFPFLVRKRNSDPNVLMGQRLHPEFGLELGIFKRRSAPDVRIDTGPEADGGTLLLAPEFGSWVDQIDLQGSLPLAAVAELADRIATRLPERSGAVA